MDTATYPAVSVGGKEFRLKYRYHDIKALADDRGIDLFEVPAFAAQIGDAAIPLRGLPLMDRVITLFAYGAQIPVPEATELITVRDLPEVINAIKQAISKVSPQATATERTTPGTPSAIQ